MRSGPRAARRRRPRTGADDVRRLNDKAPAEHGVQCCGGEVTLLLEPLAVVPAVAIFGLGHVGLELARILARHDVELHLVDSRAEQVVRGGWRGPDGRRWRASHVHHAPVPELVLGQVPAGTHVLVMTHDHAEDFALCDAALRCSHLGSIGLIGSSAKWPRFRVEARGGGPRTRRARPDHHAHRAAGRRRQGPRHHRGERRRRPGPDLRARPRQRRTSEVSR